MTVQLIGKKLKLVTNEHGVFLYARRDYRPLTRLKAQKAQWRFCLRRDTHEEVLRAYYSGAQV